MVHIGVAVGVRVGRIRSFPVFHQVAPEILVDKSVLTLKLVQLVGRIELVGRVYVDIVLVVVVAVIVGIQLPQGFDPSIIVVGIPVSPVLVVVDFPAIGTSAIVAISVVGVRSVDELLEVVELVIIGIQFGVSGIHRIHCQRQSDKGRPYH
jgi:hypothetical protein